MRGKQVTWLALSLVGLWGAAGCDTLGLDDDRTRLSVFVTDAPGDVEAVWLDIAGIVLVGAESGQTELDSDFNGLIDVTELVERTQQIIDDAELQADNYSQLRLMLNGAVLETKQGKVFATEGAELPDGLAGGNVGTLVCPSCSQSGLKVILRGDEGAIGEGDDAGLVIDFDVAQSFGHEAGKSGRWIMRPVIHAVRVADGDDDVDDEEGSAIKGTVAIQLNAGGAPVFQIPQCPAGTARTLADFVPTATAATLKNAEGQAVVRSGEVNANNGTFAIDFVQPDGYAMGFSVVDVGDFNLVWTAQVAPANVTVTAGADVTGVAYTLTGASCVAG